MRILVLHNRYRQPGGEDAAVELETRLLREHGHEVILFEAGNAPVEGAAGLVRLTRNCAWSDSSYKQVLRLCREHRPDVAHVHNFWMTLSPSVHAACHEAGVPTVQTLHNYRLLCPNALLMRDGRVCEECVGGAPWRGVLHRCYRNSILASAAVAWMISANRQRDTWNRHVDAFLVPSEFARTRFVEGGFDANRILVKPNLIADPGRPCTRPSASNMVLYAGRLSAEKGLGTLLAAWASARLDDIGQLLIAGDGPQESELRGQAQALGLTGVRFTGRMDRAEVQRLIGGARAVVLPSLCYETFGNVVVESFAAGRPAIVSDLGAIGEAVDHERTGLKVRPGDAAALGDAMLRILTDAGAADRMGHRARSHYVADFSPKRNLEMLMDAYRFATRSQEALACAI